ncbi:hypothetical protein FRC17_010224 [Serendipita sp. 399]|nr:hypothetical protein FRC17_010224 [Serendipita sp. 399]
MDNESEVTSLEALDARRLRLQQDLESLDKQRAHVLAQKAPIRRIVDDILAHIFELGAAEEVLFPEKVSAVSRHWRKLILQTPSAWSHLILDRRVFPQASLQTFIRRSEVFLQRSQSAPLTLMLDLLPISFEGDVHRLMNLLHDHFARCAILHMHIDASWLAVAAGPLSTLGPALRDLDIRTSHSNANPVTLSLSEVAGCIPALQSLVLSNLPPSCLPPTRYPALRHLQLHGVQWHFGNDGSEWPWTGTASLLEAAPNLQSLTLNRMEFILDGTELLTPRHIVLKSLKSLTFECMETRSIAIVLESLDAPNLKSLKMRYDPTKMGDHWCIHRLEASCLAGIEELEVEGYAIYGSNLPWFVRTLAMIPRLIKLVISNPPLFLDSRFFDIMATGPNWLIPRLNELHLIACANLHGQDLIRLLRARSLNSGGCGVSPIRSLTIRMSPLSMLEEDVVSVIRLNVDDLHHLPLEPYTSDRYLGLHSPMFRAPTPPPPPLPPLQAEVQPQFAPPWDPPLLGTPFGDDPMGFAPQFAHPPTYMGPRATTAGSSTTIATNRRRRSSSIASTLWPRLGIVSDDMQHIATALVVASVTALTTSIACYHLMSRHVRL